MERLVVSCRGCGGETSFADNVTASRCTFCDAPLSAQAQSRRLIQPQCVLPFTVTREQALDTFGKWIRSRWFAPSSLKSLARADHHRLRGVYLPFWTYDARTITDYDGRRGDYYYVTEQYRTQENGKTVTRTRQVRHTRWSPASGTVINGFNDLLVAASHSVPAPLCESLEPWDLESVVPFSEQYVSGFDCESYQVTLEQGFEGAQALMAPVIDASICADIGGDEQVIGHRHVRYEDVTFKHVLLPVWLCSYRFRDRVFRFVVNARTGEVQGERPWSWVKIALLVIAIATLVTAGVVVARSG